MYRVKEIFYTLQGEGLHAGRPAVFCRFSLCNLWTGREQDRHRAICKFCDTDFLGGDRYETAEALADAVEAAWPAGDTHRMVVCTGGEPLLQLDDAAVFEFRRRGFYVAVETNGTQIPPRRAGIDWLCVSPKAGANLLADEGDELKVVYPQADLDPRNLEGLKFNHYSVQPMDGPDLSANTAAAVAFCLANPRWRLSLQTHKHIGIR